MGTDINSNIVGTKRASALVNAANNLDSIYKKGLNAQKKELQNLFSGKFFNSTKDKATIENQIKTLQDKIKEYEKNIEEIQDQIADKQDKVNSKKSNVAEKVTKIVTGTENYEALAREKVDLALENAVYQFQHNSDSKAKGGNREFKSFLIEQMNSEVNGFIMTTGRSNLDRLIEELGDSQSALSKEVSGLEGLIKDIDGLNSKYASTSSTLALLQKASKDMSNAAGSYQTSDTDPSVPIFTPAKEDLADGYLGKYNSRMANRDNGETVKNTHSQEEKTALIQQFQQKTAAQTQGVDAYSANNAQLKSFGDALNSGLIEKMQNTGFNKKEMLDAIKTIYPSIGVSHGDDGAPVVPYGHGGEASNIYSTFLNQFKAVEGGGQRDDLQVAEMGKAIKNDKIVTEMKGDNFSWKECAYTLTRLWPAAGIGYNLGEKKITIPYGTGDARGNYDALAEQIHAAYPDVDIIRGTGDESVKDEAKRTDPVGIHIGDNSYEFVIDRNQDGEINDFTEMVGANGKDGMEEMKLFDTDNNGIIKGDELKNVLLLNTEHTNRDYEFLTADQLGITEINLNSFKEKQQSRPDGGKGEDFININNSLIKGTFDVKVNGKTAEGYQAYVSEDYQKAVYNPIMGENIYTELDNSDVSDIIDDNFAKASDKLQDLNDFKNDVDAANGYKDIKAALRTKLNNATNEAWNYRIRTLETHTDDDYSENKDPKELEMSTGRADRIIEEYLDEAEKEKDEE